MTFLTKLMAVLTFCLSHKGTVLVVFISHNHAVLVLQITSFEMISFGTLGGNISVM